jgi:hypothetical protein
MLLPLKFYPLFVPAPPPSEVISSDQLTLVRNPCIPPPPPLSKRRGSVVEERVDTSQYRLRDRNSRLSRPIAVVWITVTPMVTTCGKTTTKVRTTCTHELTLCLQYGAKTVANSIRIGKARNHR